MSTDLHTTATTASDPGVSMGPTLHDIEQQCLRILRCTARALANSPGGLRFKAGTRPWLDALTHQSKNFSFSTQQGV